MPDPYRWFEDPTAQTTRDWVTAENALAQPYLEKLPQRAWLGERLKQLWTYERFGVPQREGGNYFYLRNDGTQDQSVLYVADALDAPPRVLVDPNGKRDDATIALSQWVPSPDGNLLAYALSDGGTDWNTWHFRRVADGVDLPVILKFSKFYAVSWARDSSGVYYSRYPLKAGQKAEDAERGDDAGRPDVYFHKLDDAQSADRLVYQVTDHPDSRARGRRSPKTGAISSSTCSTATTPTPSSCRICASTDAKPQAAVRRVGRALQLHRLEGRRAVFPDHQRRAARTRDRGECATTPRPPHWRTVVPQDDIAITNANYVGGRVRRRVFARCAQRRAAVRGERHAGGRSETARARHRPTGFQGSGTDPETFFSYSDYLSPTRILRLDVATNTVSDFRTPKVPADFSPFVTEQVFYTSKDGTRVPMFITRRKDAPRDGNQPVMLYGYGGFNVIAVAGVQPGDPVVARDGRRLCGRQPARRRRIRRGVAPGRHAAARSRTCSTISSRPAEYLIREKYTNPKRLAIRGRSNGGLLVGAALTQRPELFGAALPAVGVMDMLRYHTASANARQWSSDFGLSEDAGGVQGAARVFAGAQREGRHVLSADAGDHRRSRRSRRALAQLQVRRRTAARAGLRRTRC